MAHYHRLVLEAQVDDVDAAFREAMAVLIAEGDSEDDAREQLLENDGSISPGACLLVLVGPVRKEVGWTFHGGSASPFRPFDADVDAESDEAEAAEVGAAEAADAMEAVGAKHVTVSFSFKVTDEDRLIEATRVNVGEADEDADRAITLYDAMGEMGPIVAMLAEELLTEMAEFGCEVTDCHVHGFDDEDLRGGPAGGYTH